jgi:hypothetical protein
MPSTRTRGWRDTPVADLCYNLSRVAGIVGIGPFIAYLAKRAAQFVLLLLGGSSRPLSAAAGSGGWSSAASRPVSAHSSAPVAAILRRGDEDWILAQRRRDTHQDGLSGERNASS